MKFLFDLFPIVLFFGMFRWAEAQPARALELAQQYLGGIVHGGVVTTTQAPVLLATATAILATFLQFVIVYAKGKKPEGALWLSLVLITVFGGLTIWFNNENFIKWKPTVLYWCFAVALLVSAAVWGKNLIKAMLGAQIKLPDIAWKNLNTAWALFFVALGFINLYVAFNYSLSTWVNFKTFWMMGLIIAFVLAQSVYLAKFMKSET